MFSSKHAPIALLPSLLFKSSFPPLTLDVYRALRHPEPMHYWRLTRALIRDSGLKQSGGSRGGPSSSLLHTKSSGHPPIALLPSLLLEGSFPPLALDVYRALRHPEPMHYSRLTRALVRDSGLKQSGGSRGAHRLLFYTQNLPATPPIALLPSLLLEGSFPPLALDVYRALGHPEPMHYWRLTRALIRDSGLKQSGGSRGAHRLLFYTQNLPATPPIALLPSLLLEGSFPPLALNVYRALRHPEPMHYSRLTRALVRDSGRKQSGGVEGGPSSSLLHTESSGHPPHRSSSLPSS